ncbi:TatD family hydrolase [Xinfangfangia sp. CPCC 101601]|uniref:TatD family hydrolase n=1 Tax=Pseudogemmobacter lacusdianii TaxID=3069608 RepID=A0ABU0W1L8_9RHOB|nr:TatD family hydrolase [Xinfangfangia sp. CPCC 101601]MDQ2067859.1 TatD family hydrolase [Xinfangfangia sp. CPCC 101601]
MTPPPELVDSHCHLDFADFDGELDQIIARASEAGVKRMVHICTKPDRLARAIEIAEAYENIFYAYGIHPMSAGEVPALSVADLIEAAKHPKMVGIGETGLDFHYTPDSAPVQRESLRIHIEAAQETGLPLIIHARAADEEIEAILGEGMAAKPYSCVMHCFSSGPRLAEAALEMGFYLSMSGIAAFPKSSELREIFARAPLDRILVETDSPYLAPPPYRGRRNEPAYTAFTAKTGAQVFGVSEAEFAAATTANFDRLFWKANAARKAA